MATFYKKVLTFAIWNGIIVKRSKQGIIAEFREDAQINIAEWSSPVARRAHNPKVVGSNPASATT